jgi:hypothetical protein
MHVLGSVVNGQLGVVARIGALRRSSPEVSPQVPTLIAAEFPILAVEATLAALASFTLIAPLGLPWWLPLIGIAVVGLGQLPAGPGAGAAAAVLILGRHGVAAAAAAGVIMTVTGTVGGLIFVVCGTADHLWPARRAEPSFRCRRYVDRDAAPPFTVRVNRPRCRRPRP